VYFDAPGEAQSVMGADLTALMGRWQEAAHRTGVELLGTGGFAPAESLRPIGAERPWSGCTRPWRSTYVTANGNVLPCCFAPFTTGDYQGVILGNVFERPMSEIWNGSAYEAFRRAHASDDPPECCRGCGTRWMY
jgi:radical SAM protein with 4Fe4S-binding SPASM domain